MVDLTVNRIVNLAGKWTDDSRASKQFHEIIENEQTTTDEGETGDGPTTSRGTTTTDWDGPQTGADAIQATISRAELDGDSGATVAVFPSQTSGIDSV